MRLVEIHGRHLLLNRIRGDRGGFDLLSEFVSSVGRLDKRVKMTDLGVGTSNHSSSIINSLLSVEGSLDYQHLVVKNVEKNIRSFR